MPPEQEADEQDAEELEHGTALYALRKLSGVSFQDLADRSGRDKAYLASLGTKHQPGWDLLVELCVAHMDRDLETVIEVVWAHSRAAGKLPVPPASPIPVTPEELRAIRRQSGPVGRQAVADHEERLIRGLRAEKVLQARVDAVARCEVLLSVIGKARRQLLDQPVFQTFAVAERLCELSIAACAKTSWKDGLKIARLAWRVARRLPGSEAWRAMILAYTRAFIANAWRVGGDLDKADRLFTRAVTAWTRHRAADPDRILADWRLLQLEASLRSDQRRFAEALKLHTQARDAAPPEAVAWVVVGKARTLTQMLDCAQALAALQEAAPWLAAAQDERLTYVHAFLTGGCFCELGRFGAAAEWHAVALKLAASLHNARDLITCRWLGGRIAGGLGQLADALAAFRSARRSFKEDQQALNYALVSLEEAVLLFRLGEYARVQRLVRDDMAWIFQAQGLHCEALAALELFRQAVAREEATQDLAWRVHSYLVEAGHNPPGRRFKE